MARDFAQISCTIWNSRKLRSLQSDDAARLLYFYLHSNELTNNVGCYVLKIGAVIEDMGWTESKVRKAIDSLCKAGLIGFDRDERVVRLVGFLEKFPTTNPKHAAGCFRVATALPDCGEKCALFKSLANDLHASGLEGLAEESDRLSKRYRYKETDTETGTETDTETGTDATRPRATRLSPDWKPSDQDRAYAKGKNLTDIEIDEESIAFVRYWTGPDAKNPAKKDWHRTWCNRIDEVSHKIIARRPRFPAQNPKPEPVHIGTPRSTYVARYRGWMERGFWIDGWGPKPPNPRQNKPGEPGYDVPQDVIDQVLKEVSELDIPAILKAVRPTEAA